MDIEKILKDFMPIGVLLTFIASVLTIYFTRKNMKSTKYIDTITSERIKWMELIRNDLSVLCSDLIILFNSANRGIKSRQEQEEMARVLYSVGSEEDRKNIFKDVFDDKEAEYRNIQQKIHDDERKIQIIKRIYLIILRLNPNEDQEIINRLKDIKNIIQKNIYEQTEIDMCLSLIEVILEKSQHMLKSEWEKVKEETIKGSKI